MKRSRELREMLREGRGYRCESFRGAGVRKARDVLRYEIYVLGNEDVLWEACSALGIPRRDCDFDRMVAEIEGRFGEGAEALWLATERDARENYCEPGEEPDEYEIPEGALPIWDLGDEGALFAWRKWE